MDWPKFVKRLLLAEGRINETEAELIERAILDGDAISQDEIAFLACLKREASWVHPRFDALLFKVLKSMVLLDGKISDAEACWLRKLLIADHQISNAEVDFVKQLKREAKSYGPEFEKLYKECTQLSATEFIG